MLTLLLLVTLKYVNFSTVYNDKLVAKELLKMEIMIKVRLKLNELKNSLDKSTKKII